MTLSSRLDKIEKALPPDGVALSKILDFIDNLPPDESIEKQEMLEFKDNLLKLEKKFLIIDDVFDVMPSNLRRRVLESLKEKINYQD